MVELHRLLSVGQAGQSCNAQLRAEEGCTATVTRYNTCLANVCQQLSVPLARHAR